MMRRQKAQNTIVAMYSSDNASNKEVQFDLKPTPVVQIGNHADIDLSLSNSEEEDLQEEHSWNEQQDSSESEHDAAGILPTTITMSTKDKKANKNNKNDSLSLINNLSLKALDFLYDIALWIILVLGYILFRIIHPRI